MDSGVIGEYGCSPSSEPVITGVFEVRRISLWMLGGGVLIFGVGFGMGITPGTELIIDGDRVTGAVVSREGTEVRINARRGVVLAAGGFDHLQSGDGIQRRAAAGRLGPGR